MRAKDIMAAGRVKTHVFPYRNVNEDMPAVNVLPLLLDAPDGMLGVKSDNGLEGVIDRDSLLEGLGRMIAPRDDCSVITVRRASPMLSKTATRILWICGVPRLKTARYRSHCESGVMIRHRRSIALSVTVMMSFPLMATATATTNWRQCAFLS